MWNRALVGGMGAAMLAASCAQSPPERSLTIGAHAGGTCDANAPKAWFAPPPAHPQQSPAAMRAWPARAAFCTRAARQLPVTHVHLCRGAVWREPYASGTSKRVELGEALVVEREGKGTLIVSAGQSWGNTYEVGPRRPTRSGEALRFDDRQGPNDTPSTVLTCARAQSTRHTKPAPTLWHAHVYATTLRASSGPTFVPPSAARRPTGPTLRQHEASLATVKRLGWSAPRVRALLATEPKSHDARLGEALAWAQAHQNSALELRVLQRWRPRVWCGANRARHALFQRYAAVCLRRGRLGCALEMLLITHTFQHNLPSIWSQGLPYFKPNPQLATLAAHTDLPRLLLGTLLHYPGDPPSELHLLSPRHVAFTLHGSPFFRPTLRLLTAALASPTLDPYNRHRVTLAVAWLLHFQRGDAQEGLRKMSYGYDELHKSAALIAKIPGALPLTVRLIRAKRFG